MDGVLQTHDGRGNRTGAAGRTWRYDSRNMLVGANAPGMAATYGYYPEGGRAWKQVNGVTTLYLELDGVEWGTYDAAGTLTERTIRASGAGGAVVAVQSATGGLIRLLPNRQGSVIGWLRPDGKLGGAYTYDAYGNSPQAGAGGPQFRYAGMRFDAETGLYHTPNRAYDPADGRWMQLDPIGIKDGLNRYAYVRNSPLMGVDPTGLQAVIPAPIPLPLPLPPIVDPNSKENKEWVKWGERNLTKALAAIVNAKIGIQIASQSEAAQDDSQTESSSDGGREVEIDQKIKDQLGPRGWTEKEVREVAKTPPIGETVDRRRPSKTPDGQGRNDPASVYGSRTDGHIVVNDVTGEVTQISDKINPWIPDGRIKWKQSDDD